MAHSSTVKALARWTVDFFQTGVTMTPEHLRYIETTFATSDLAVILGEYLGRIFNETKRRPLYFVNEYLPSAEAGSRRSSGSRVDEQQG